MAIVGGTRAFLFQQHLAETAFFAELFEKFNARYDDMNEDLQKLLKKEGSFDEAERSKVVDYFNLCAEEFLFYDTGYIDQSVWRAWVSGMRHYARDPRFQQVWHEDGGGDSYYGFVFPPE